MKNAAEVWHVVGIVALLLTVGLSACDSGGSSSESAPAAANPDVSTFQWQGDWQDSTRYSMNDIVYFEGEAYVNIQPTLGGEAPDNGEYWDVLASRGDAGAAGPEGLPGAMGPIGAYSGHADHLFWPKVITSRPNALGWTISLRGDHLASLVSSSSAWSARIDFPFSANRWELCTSRSRIASASVASPMAACQSLTGS